MALAPLDLLAAMAPTDLLRAQAKFTHVGPQLEPVSTVLFSVYTITPRIAAFVHDKKGIHYGNDHLRAVTTFTVKHAEFHRFLGLLADTAKDHTEDGDWTSVSVMTDIDESKTHELLLNEDESAKLIDSLLDEIGPGNVVAQQVLGDFRRGP